MLYVSARQGNEYAITDTSDSTTEYITEEQLWQLLYNDVSIYGATLKGYNLYVSTYADLQSIVDSYNSRFLALGRKPQLEVMVESDIRNNPKRIVCGGVAVHTVKASDGYHICAGKVRMPDFVESLILNPRYKEGYHHFSYVEFDGLVLSSNLKSLRLDMFERSIIKGDLIMPKSLRRTWAGTFKECRIEGDLRFSDGLEEFNGFEFLGCHIKGNLYLPSSITKFAAETFRNCVVDGKVLLSTPIKEHRNVHVAYSTWWNFKCGGFGEGVRELYKIDVQHGMGR